VCQNLELVQDVTKPLTSSEPFDIDSGNLMTTTKPKDLIQQTKEKGLSYSNYIVNAVIAKLFSQPWEKRNYSTDQNNRLHEEILNNLPNMFSL